MQTKMRAWFKASVACLFTIVFACATVAAVSAGSWAGLLSDASGNPLRDATIHLRPDGGELGYVATTSASGRFTFAQINAGTYALSIERSQKTWTLAKAVVIADGMTRTDHNRFCKRPGL